MLVDRPMYNWTDIMKLIVAFHNIANTCNKLNTLIICRMYSMASESKMPENVHCTWGFHFPHQPLRRILSFPAKPLAIFLY
jgi:hypothetical protein